MTPYLQDPDVTLYAGDSATVFAELPAASVDCIVTSPPYWGLRDYGYPEQIGLEADPAAYVAALVEVFRAARRVLAPHGTCWLNIGDSYAGSWGNQGRKSERGTQRPVNGPMLTPVHDGRYPDRGSRTGAIPAGVSWKPKDLMLLPFEVAKALRDDGWWLRKKIVWAKPNPMPESVTDRPTSAHEEVFLLAKAERYYYDQEGSKEADSGRPSGNGFVREHRLSYAGRGQSEEWQPGGGRNMRDVWTIATEPTPEAHFATFPRELVRRCLAAGCPLEVCKECGQPRRRIVERVPTGVVQKAPDGSIHRNGRQAGETGVEVTAARTLGWTDCGHGAFRTGRVLDPFIGSGTTAVVARALGLHAVGIDASEEYLGIAARRLRQLSLLGDGA